MSEAQVAVPHLDSSLLACSSDSCSRACAADDSVSRLRRVVSCGGAMAGRFEFERQLKGLLSSI